MAGISFKGKVIGAVNFKTVGKKNTPLAEVTIAEEVVAKEGKEWVVTGHNNYVANVWGDKAVEASTLQVGDEIDARAFLDENDRIKFNAKIDEQTWQYKDKDYSKLVVTLFDWEVASE
jgi:hypothetical protein